MSRRSQEINRIQKRLNKLSGMCLQDWLDKASEIDELKNVVEGFYCGEDGRIHVPLEESNPKSIWLTMGWHTVTTPRVEYAYVS